MKKFNLNPQKNNSPIIIAEFSSNHNQSLETAISTNLIWRELNLPLLVKIKLFFLLR